MTSTKFNIEREIPTWFALSQETITKYGKTHHKITIKNDLKLLNITTFEFQYDLFNKMNSIIGPELLTNTSLRRMKAITLMAFGLPNYHVQVEFMKKYLVNLPPQYNDINMLIDTCTLIGKNSKLILSKNCFSINFLR